MDVRSMRNAVLGARVVNALKSRNMDAYYVETKEEAVAKALELMPKGSTISWGGTMSVAEAGLMDAIRNGDYTLYDRDQAETAKEREEMMHQAFFADFFLGSTNAVSEDGVLVNIDGVANRVAAYAYGPKNVLLIVGMNKVVKTQEDALHRARNEAAPINAQRFQKETPCVSGGTCFDCKKQGCICSQILITRYSQMLEIAREKQIKSGHEILYLLQDMREFELYGTVGAVFSICDSLNYITEPEELKQVFRWVNNYLDPGGIFIFDFNTEYKYREVLGDQTIAEAREDCSFIWDNYYYEEERINEYELNLFIREDAESETEGDLYRRFRETHFQRAYTLEEITRIVEESGLQFVTAYEAFTKEPPSKNSERIYVIAREQGKVPVKKAE